MEENELRATIANNISYYRKQLNLTQADLAQKLNYSDKAVSKWERAEAMPDIYILCKLAEVFKVTINDLTSVSANKKIYIGIPTEKRVIIPLMSVFIVFLLATVIFCVVIMLDINLDRAWLCFIYALPASAVCYIVFSAIWRKPIFICIFGSILVWTLALSLFVTFNTLQNSFTFFLIGIPIQAIIILWYVMVRINAARRQPPKQDPQAE